MFDLDKIKKVKEEQELRRKENNKNSKKNNYISNHNQSISKQNINIGSMLNGLKQEIREMSKSIEKTEYSHQFVRNKEEVEIPSN